MKRPCLSAFLCRLILVVGCLGLAATVGYRLGRSDRPNAGDDPSNNREVENAAARAPEEWKHQGLWSAAQADRLAGLLIDRAKRSPAPSVDWELQAEFHKIFASLPVDRFKELNAAFLKIDAADGDEQSDPLCAVWAEMLEEWATKDGRAAMDALASEAPGDFKNVFRAWAAADLDSLLAWIQEGRKTAIHSGFRWAPSMGFPIDALDDVAEKDPARLEKIIAEMPSSEAESVIRYFATRWPTDPERRAFVLDLAGRHDCLTDVRQSLVGYWQNKEPQTALDFIAALDAPAEEKAELDALALTKRMKTDPAAAMTLWVKRNETQVPPTSGWLVLGVGDWASRDQEGAIEWLMQCPEGGQRDQFCNAAVDALVAKGADRSSTTSLATMIRDNKLRLKALRRIYWDCRKEGSGVAAKWLEEVSETEHSAITAE